MKTRFHKHGLTLLAAALILTNLAAAQVKVSRSVIASGGGISAGSGVILAGTVGQSVIGRIGDRSIASQGFWYTIADRTSTVVYDEIATGRDHRSPGLWQNVPDPFSENTVIRIDLPQRTHVTLKLYDAVGREVRTLVDEEHEAGRITLQIDADGLGSGHYAAMLTAGSIRRSITMTVVR